MISMKFCSTALTGQPVDMTVSQNGVTRALSVEAFGVPKAPPVAPAPSARLTISLRRGQQQVAPEGIAFFAEVEGFDSVKPTDGKVYDPTMHDISYVWDFGDPGTFSALDRVPTEWKNRNVGYGPFPAHVFATPGTYTILCAAHERSSGKVAYGSIDVTVQDPEAVFTSATTICIDPDGDFTGAPTTEPANRVTSWAAALTRAGTFAGGSNLVRILLRSGKIFDVSAVGWFGVNMKNAYVSTWGGSAKAKLRSVAPYSFGPIVAQKELRTSGASFSNLELDGQWDAALPGIKVDAVWSGDRRPGGGLNVQGGFVTFYNITTTGVGGNSFGRGKVGGITAIASNMVSQGWQNIGWFLDSEGTASPTDPLTNYFALVGCRITQDEQATMGGNYRASDTDKLDNEHGVMRIQACAYAYIDALEGFSRTGWTVTGGVPYEQSICRDARNDSRSKGYFSRMMGEAGSSLYSKGTATSSDIVQPCNGVLDKFMYMGGSRSTAAISIITSATTVRNGVINRANTIQGPDGYNYGIDIGDNPTRVFDTAGNHPINIYNVTNVNEQSSANMPSVWTPVNIRPGCYVEGMVKVQNNIIHRPNANVPVTADAPLSNARLGLASRHKGWRWRTNAGWVTGSPQLLDKLTMDTAYALPADPWSFFRPLAGSSAIGSATGDLVAYDDLLGNVRPASASRGAIEPA